jgi:hypothetical protein
MFLQTPPNENDKLNEIIDEVLSAMAGGNCGTDEYAKMADQLIKLYKAKEIDSKIKIADFEAIGKQNETEAKLKQADTDSYNKHEEFNTSHAFKMVEFSLKEQEARSNSELHDVEIELKKKEIEDFRRVKSDTLALIAANIAGIIAIISHERINIVTSKALGFVSKLHK